MPSKKIKLKLYADECFPITSVRFLRGLGISIIHASYKNYLGKSDSFHIRVSKQLKRTLITIDRDFLYNWKTLKSHPGIILVDSGSQVDTAINKVCRKTLPKLTPHFVAESLVKISNVQIMRNKENNIEVVKI